MNFEQLYPSRFLRAGDIGETPVTLTIASVGSESVGGEPKAVVAFTDGRKLIANKTNGKTLAKAFGPKTEGWVGKPITLFTAMVQFKDDVVQGIRVRPAKAAAAGPNDEIPF